MTYRANTFVEVLSANGYRTAAIGKSYLQTILDMGAEQRVDPGVLGLIKEAWKDDNEKYDHEMPASYQGNTRYEFPACYYGYEHVDMVTNHGDQAGGHYAQWLRSQSAEADNWRERKYQLPHSYVCPQAFRTPIPEELYSTSYIRDRVLAYLDEVTAVDRPFL